MANELKWVAGAEKTLQNADGASVSNAGYQQASTADLTSADCGAYPWLSFESVFTFSVAPTVGSVVDIYAMAMNFESTNDNEVPQLDFQNTYVASIPLNDVVTAQYFKTPPVSHPYPLNDCRFYIANRSGQTLSANWTLKVTPLSYAPTA